MEQLYLLLALILILPVIWYFYSYDKKKTSSSSVGGLLIKYSRDLTRLASEKELDPVIGRDAEIKRVIEILSRKTKNNPVLVGSAGVGKTAIAEGLALSIVDKQVPSILAEKKVLALDLTGILAGTKYRGEFEGRLKKITDEILAAKRSIILFIDEIHILAEAGEAEGAINAADILKPLLARGELQVVGATTKDEYLKFIKNDKTLDRRLQPVFVAEPNLKQTEEILQGVKATYEKYHQVSVSSEAIKAAIINTKNIKSRSFPDKAIDAIDEACSRVRISNMGSKKIPLVKASDVRGVVKEWII
jgi:ATP-dependent Clp protease ATP-binding subunit ClpC